MMEYENKKKINPDRWNPIRAFWVNCLNGMQPFLRPPVPMAAYLAGIGRVRTSRLQVLQRMV